MMRRNRWTGGLVVAIASFVHSPDSLSYSAAELKLT